MTSYGNSEHESDTQKVIHSKPLFHNHIISVNSESELHAFETASDSLILFKFCSQRLFLSSDVVLIHTSHSLKGFILLYLRERHLLRATFAQI